MVFQIEETRSVGWSQSSTSQAYVRKQTDVQSSMTASLCTVEACVVQLTVARVRGNARFSQQWRKGCDACGVHECWLRATQCSARSKVDSLVELQSSSLG